MQFFLSQYICCYTAKLNTVINTNTFSHISGRFESGIVNAVYLEFRTQFIRNCERSLFKSGIVNAVYLEF